jgi:BirA family transcriptional regulator, biotin operon repressor / biotin---[acetyl-CoA-carboxylase] ligase
MPLVRTEQVYDGVACSELASSHGAPDVRAVARCASTMDLAHAMGDEFAPHGSVIVADTQDAGRGRSGKRWASGSKGGVWASVLLRQTGPAPQGLLSLRTGMALAKELDRLARTQVQLKWPNDLWQPEGKLAGILTEARWRGDAMEWIVVGIGVNLSDAAAGDGHPLHAYPKAGLQIGASRAAVLGSVIRAVLSAARCSGDLDRDELHEFAQRDLARGKQITEPVAGTIVGISPNGALLVQTNEGEVLPLLAGSIVFATRSGA